MRLARRPLATEVKAAVENIGSNRCEQIVEDIRRQEETGHRPNISEIAQMLGVPLDHLTSKMACALHERTGEIVILRGRHQ